MELKNLEKNVIMVQTTMDMIDYVEQIVKQ
jgi:hypothetical protein